MAHTYYSKTNTFSFNLYDIRVINDRFCVCLQKKKPLLYLVLENTLGTVLICYKTLFKA